MSANWKAILLPREHGLYVLVGLPVFLGAALNSSRPLLALAAAAGWALLGLSSAGIKLWLSRPAQRHELTLPLTVVVVGAAGLLAAGRPYLPVLIVMAAALAGLGIYYWAGNMRDRRSLAFESLAAVVFSAGSLVPGSAGLTALDPNLMAAALVFGLVQTTATIHVRLWVTACASRDPRTRWDEFEKSLFVHGLAVGILSGAVAARWVPSQGFLPGLAEGACVALTVPWFGQRISFPRLGIAQTITLAITVIILIAQFRG